MTHIRTTNFDALAASAPLDRQASVVRDGSGEGWEGRVPAFVDHWKAPPAPLCAKPEEIPDLTGRRIGRLTVVRFHRRKNGGQWLVRCDCGDYEVRRSSVITDFKGTLEACCHACDWLRLIKAKAAAKNTRSTREASSQALDRLSQQHGGQR